MFIRSERLFLRPGWPEDWTELFALIDDEAVVRGLSQAPWPYRADDARAFAARVQDGQHPHFFVTRPGADGAELIGCVGLLGDDHADGDAGSACPPLLGYWIARRHWAKGYATEATQALLGLAATLGHRRIEARHFIDNLASRRVLQKLGFRPTGEIRPGLSPARDDVVPTLCYALDLDPPRNCDDHLTPVPHAA